MGTVQPGLVLGNMGIKRASTSDVLEHLLVLSNPLDIVIQILSLVRFFLTGLDIKRRWERWFQVTNHTAPVLMSGNGFFPLCPASLGIGALCANRPPSINIGRVTIVYSDGATTFVTSPPVSGTSKLLIPEDMYGPVANTVQTILAAARIDLGNPSPNNFLLNPSVLSETIFRTFPATDHLDISASVFYQTVDSYQHQGILPLTVEGPASMRVVYACRLQRMKAPGPVFVSTLVATLSMFSSGWALFTLFAGYWSKRGSEGEILAILECVQHFPLWQPTVVMHTKPNPEI
jgi:hypothetical protein